MRPGESTTAWLIALTWPTMSPSAKPSSANALAESAISSVARGGRPADEREGIQRRGRRCHDDVHGDCMNPIGLVEVLGPRAVPSTGSATFSAVRG